MLKHLILCLAVLHITIPGLLTECIKCSVTPHPEFHNKVSLMYKLWTKEDVNTNYDCSAECIYDSRCHSFIHNALKRRCIGYASSLSSPGRMQAFPDGGSRAYLMCTAAGQIGDACLNDDQCGVPSSVCLSGICDCPPFLRYGISSNRCVALSLLKCETNGDCQTDNSVCYQNNCKCDVGYSYSPSDFTCVQACSSYGDTFTSWDAMGIDGCNDDTRQYQTAQECKESCSSSPNCRNAEYAYSSGVCNLCFSTWFQMAAYQSTDSPGWIIYIKNCKQR